METTEQGRDMVRYSDLPNAIIIKIIHEVQKSRAKDLKLHKEKMEKRARFPGDGLIVHSLRRDIEMWRCPCCRAKSFMSSLNCFKCCEPNPEKYYTFSSL